MVFPEPTGILERSAVLESLGCAERWDHITFADERLIEIADGTVHRLYRAVAERSDGGSEYAALITTTYVDVNGSWRLVSHQQTPIDTWADSHGYAADRIHRLSSPSSDVVERRVLDAESSTAASALLKSSESYRFARESDQMQALPKSRLLRFVEQAYHLARRAVARYSSKFSKRRYTLHQHIVLLCLKVRKNTTYRTLLDELIEMPRIQSAIELEELPSPSTLCRAFNRLEMAVWRVLLNLSVALLPTNGVVGIDASGFDRSHASKHYTKRTKLTIQQLKVTLLVDTGSNAIIDIHVTTTRKHDSKIAPSLIKRNNGDVVVLLGDKGYDDQKVRALARETGIRPLIKHREFSSLHKAWNARLDADLYAQRSQNETVNSRLKRKYGAFVRSRHWWKQFRELAVGCLTHNIDKTL